MGRKARVYDAALVKKFEDKFYSEFPQVKDGATFQWKDATKVMRQLGLNPRNGDEYPFYFFTNKVAKGVYKMPQKPALIKGTPEADAALAPKVKVKANKSIVAKGPSVNSQRWASGKAPLKEAKVAKSTKSDRDVSLGYDNSVEFEDVMSLRGEFGLGEFRNSMDF
jgi:hypothetical protein